MVDVFEEVEEQLRSDRYKSLARSWLPWVIGVSTALSIAFFFYPLPLIDSASAAAATLFH